eukprot:6911746-Pyramimonas_sp.AAC.1
MHNAACKADMTKQERIMRTMRELYSPVRTADVTTALQLIWAAGRQGGRAREHTRVGGSHI